MSGLSRVEHGLRIKAYSPIGPGNAMKLFLHLFLIAVVVGCPLWCPAGLCDAPASAGGERIETSRCCRHCSPGESSERSGRSSNRPAEPSDCPCQCFCSHAVLGTLGDGPLVVDLPTAPFDAPPVASVALLRPVRDSFGEIPPPPLLTGRDRLVLYMSLLC